MRRRRPFGVIAITFLVAVFLTVLPLPDAIQAFRPLWLMLVLIYWVMEVPEAVGMVTAWCLGLLIDVMSGAVLGQHALAFMVVAYLTYQLQYQLRVFPIWQQAIAVFLFISLAQLLILWSNALMGLSVSSYWQYWSGIVVSALLWPWIYSFLKAYQRRYRIHSS